MTLENAGYLFYIHLVFYGGDESLVSPVHLVWNLDVGERDPRAGVALSVLSLVAIEELYEFTVILATNKLQLDMNVFSGSYLRYKFRLKK